MYRSANLSGLLPKIKFIQNGVDEIRRNATIKINNLNNGASFVRLPEDLVNESESNQPLKTVLLTDITEAIKTYENPKQLIIKIDVELFECRVFLGSSNLFKVHQNVPISAIIMEWVFRTGDGRFSEVCPRGKLIRMTKMLLNSGYIPFDTRDLTKLDYGKFGTDWSTNVLWVLNTTDSTIKTR